jgi:hypothetical protein
MHHQRFSPRAEYRQQENQRANDSANLAERFRDLKSLTVDLAHFAPERLTKTSEIKYTVNLAHAKSVFRFNCTNDECVGGDFDLSAALANAVFFTVMRYRLAFEPCLLWMAGAGWAPLVERWRRISR